MRTAEYLETFEKHLRVGEPKRSELLAEIRSHLNELGQNDDVEQTLGDPKKLSCKLNRTHIGFWYSEFHFYIVIVGVSFAFLFGHLGIMNYLRLRPEFITTTFFQMLRDFVGNAGFIIPLIIAIWFGWNMSKINQPVKIIAKAIPITLLLVTFIAALELFEESLFGFLPDINTSFVDTLMPAMILGIFKLLPYIFLTLLASLIGSEPAGKSKKTKMQFVKFQIFIGSFLVFLSFFLSAFVSDVAWAQSADLTFVVALVTPITIASFLGMLFFKRIRTLQNEN